MVWGAYYLRGYLVSLGRLNYEFGLKEKHEYADRFGPDAAYIYLHIPSAPNGLQDDEVGRSIALRSRNSMRVRVLMSAMSLCQTALWSPSILHR